MNHDNPALRRFVWPVSILVLGPILSAGLFSSWYGILPHLSGSHASSVWPWILLLACYSLPIIAVLRWNRLGAGIVLSTTLVGTQTIVAGNQADSDTIIQIQFGDYQVGHGIDVICNGVLLGVTPFLMTDAEFDSKVVPWTRPPDQPAVSNYAVEFDSPQGKDLTNWEWTWTASNPFINPFRQPYDSTDYAKYHDAEKLKLFLKTAPYWWRFEKTGCQTLRRMEPLSGGGISFDGVVRLRVNPGVVIPAKQTMYAILLSSLRSLDYQPSAEWSAFVWKHQDELSADLTRDAETDSRLARALDHLADDHFKIPPDADLLTSRQALDRIFDNLSRRESSSFNWLCERSALRIARAWPQLLVERTRQEITSLPTDWLFDQSYSVRGRRTCLFHLLSEVHPPELFDLVVYLYALQHQRWAGDRGPDLLIAIGNSGRAEALPILRNYFDQVWNENTDQRMFPFSERDQETSLWVMTKVSQPDLRREFLQLINDKLTPGRHRQSGALPVMIESYIAAGSDLLDLTQWIVRCCLTDKQKGLLLARIDNPSAGAWLRTMGRRLGDHEREHLMDEVCQLPANSASAAFLVETWERQDKLNPAMTHPTWNLAILRLDTPRIRDFITERLKFENSSDLYRQSLKTLPEDIVPGRLAHLEWLLDELRNARPSQKYHSLSLLVEIGTNGALALIHEWAEDPRSGISSQAAAILHRPEEQATRKRQENAERLVKANELLTGRINPDSLIPPFPTAKWTGETYEAMPASEPRK